jgi:LPXTG-motif cell wall-anchored protein
MRIGPARRISGIAVAVLCVAAVGFASSPARAAKASPATLFAGDAVPTTAAVDDPGPVEVGVRFTPVVTGKVTGIRFYQGEGNTGPHTGSIWSEGGSLRARVTFPASTTVGWQTESFSPAVPVTAGTTYVASYFAPHGHYAADQHFFDSKLTSGPLSAPAKNNGVFRYGSASGFPNGSFNATNYWVDPLFEPAGAAPSTYSFFTTADKPDTENWNDPSDVEVGVKFSSDVEGTVTALRFYKGTQNTGEHTGSLCTADGTQVATATFAGESKTGWQTVTFNPPVAIKAGRAYLASYHTSVGFYSVSTDVFANFGPDSGPLHVPAGGSAFHLGAGFPDRGSSHNYWVDIVFKPTPVASPSPSTPAPSTSATGPAASPGTGSGGTGGGSGTLPITGTNVAFVVAGGLLLVGVGVVLFVGYRRRRPVKFVA